MGYYTRHIMTVINSDGDEIDSSRVPEFELKVLDGNSTSVQEIISELADSCKWYEHAKDMLELSKTFPEYLFILDGDGEENGDAWREFYKNGRSYRWQLPKIIRPKFEEDKLK